MSPNYRLLSNTEILRNYSQLGLHNGRIKITSEDQFVPLLLAGVFGNFNGGYSVPHFNIKNVNISAEDYKQLSRINPFNGQVVNTAENRELYLKTVKEVLAINVAELLNSPIPNEYTLTSYFKTNSATADGILHGRYTHNTWLQHNTTHLFGLGFIAKRMLRVVPFSSMATNLYPSIMYNTQSNIADLIKPVVLILIKAKHLKYVRAKLFTKQPLNLPIPDMKLVRTATSSGDSYYGAWGKDLFGKLIDEGLTLEFLSSEEISKFLFNPTPNKSAEQVLKDARTELEAPVEMFV